MPSYPFSLRRNVRRLLRDREGVAAVEFAMIGPPFLALICAIFSAGLQILSQQTLDDALEAAGRTMFTGVFQSGANGTDPTARLKTLMCAQPKSFSCADLQIEVTIGTTFSNPTARSAYDPKTGAMTQGFGTAFSCPTGDQIVTIRAAVPISGLFLPLSVAGVRMADGRNLLTSTAVFRTEPYAQTQC